MLSFFFSFLSFSHLCACVCVYVEWFNSSLYLMWNYIRFVTFSPFRLAHNFTFLVSFNYWSCSLEKVKKSANFSKNTASHFVNFSINVNLSNRQAFHIHVLYIFFWSSRCIFFWTTSIVSFVVVVIICYILFVLS